MASCPCSDHRRFHLHLHPLPSPLAPCVVGRSSRTDRRTQGSRRRRTASRTWRPRSDATRPMPRTGARAHSSTRCHICANTTICPRNTRGKSGERFADQSTVRVMSGQTMHTRREHQHGAGTTDQHDSIRPEKNKQTRNSVPEKAKPRAAQKSSHRAGVVSAAIRCAYGRPRCVGAIASEKQPRSTCAAAMAGAVAITPDAEAATAATAAALQARRGASRAATACVSERVASGRIKWKARSMRSFSGERKGSKRKTHASVTIPKLHVY